jgi:metal-responsive CopG/Arc/MetJ family transcriptional regulator
MKPTPPAKEAEKEKVITLTLPHELLEKVNQAAKALNLSRAGFVKMTLTKAVEKSA